MIPAVVSALAGVTLFIGVFALWQSFRASFGGIAAGEGLVTMPVDQRQIELQEQLDAVLRTLKDIELEHDTGKIVDADFARMEAELRARAKGLLQERDAGLGPYLEQARTRVAAYLREVGVEPPSNAEAAGPVAAEPEAKDSPLAARECASCGTVNDPDARFCKSCGTAVATREGDEVER